MGRIQETEYTKTIPNDADYVFTLNGEAGTPGTKLYFRDKLRCIQELGEVSFFPKGNNIIAGPFEKMVNIKELDNRNMETLQKAKESFEKAMAGEAIKIEPHIDIVSPVRFSEMVKNGEIDKEGNRL